MVLRGGHPFDLHLAEPLTLTTIFWVLATGPSSVLSYHSVRENPLFLCKKNVEELKKRKDAFKSRSCLQEHSKETFFNPGQRFIVNNMLIGTFQCAQSRSTQQVFSDVALEIYSMLCFYRTQVSLGSGLWVPASLTPYKNFVKLC